MRRGQLLGLLHVLGQERRGEVSAVGKIPIQRRLPNPRSPRDLVHRDVCALGEQLAGGIQNRLPIALSILAQGCFGRGGHGNESSTGRRCPQGPPARCRSACKIAKLDSLLRSLYNCG